MGFFIMLTTLTDEGRETIKKHPARIKEVNKEVERMGAKILAQYAVLGQYDFVISSKSLKGDNEEHLVN